MWGCGIVRNELRLKSGAKQTDIAKHIDVLPRAIRFYESGEREPNHETTIKLADFFKVSVDYLLGRSDSPVSRGDTVLAKCLRELRKEKNVTIEDVADYLGELGAFYWRYEAAINEPDINSNLNLIHGLEQIRRTRRIVA